MANDQETMTDAMTLEQFFHTRWAAAAELNSLLPAERVFTGRSRGASPPYATLARETSRPLARTSGGDVEEITLRLHIWHDDYETGQAIVRSALAVFDRVTIELDGGSRLISIRPSRRSDRQHEDGRWQFTLLFLARLFDPKEPQS